LCDFITDNLTEDNKQAVASHLASCPFCNKELEDLKKIVALMRKGAGVPPDLSTTVMKSIQQSASERTTKLRHQLFFFLSRKYILGTAAVLVVAAVFSIFITQGWLPAMRHCKKLDLLIPGANVKTPITILVDDTTIARGRLYNLIHSRGGTVVKEYEVQAGVMVVLQLERKKEKDFLKEIGHLGLMNLIPSKFKDRMGNIVIVLQRKETP